MTIKSIISASSSSGVLKPQDVYNSMKYQGDGVSGRVITDNINRTKGFLDIFKDLDNVAGYAWYDSDRGVTKKIDSTSGAAEVTDTEGVQSFDNTSVTIGDSADLNTNLTNYIKMTFRKAARFFDLISYTGNGIAGRQLVHELDVVPGWIVVKAKNANNWICWHTAISSYNSVSPTKYIRFSTAAATDSGSATVWGNNTITIDPTASVVTLGTWQEVNQFGVDYEMYLFADDQAPDGIIRCGGYSAQPLNTIINVGFEIQTLIIKDLTQSFYHWYIFDNERTAGNPKQDIIRLDDTIQEYTNSNNVSFTASGFQLNSIGGEINGAGSDYLWIAVKVDI